jgi:hypothetical protein
MYGARTGNYLETSLWLFAALYYYSFVLERKRRLHGVNQMWRGLHSKKARPKHNGNTGPRRHISSQIDKPALESD